MKKYFIGQGGTQSGPFSLEELKTMNLDANCLVWFANLEKWTKISQIEELKDLFLMVKASVPPPLPIPPPVPIPPPAPVSPPPIIPTLAPAAVTNTSLNKSQKIDTQLGQQEKELVKNYKPIYWFLLIAVFTVGILLMISQNKNRTGASASIGNNVYLVSTGNNVNMRNSPNLDASIIHQLSLSEEVLYLNQRSTYRESAKTKGVTYNSYWYYVALKNNPSITGWVHGGFLSVPSYLQ